MNLSSGLNGVIFLFPKRWIGSLGQAIINASVPSPLNEKSTCIASPWQKASLKYLLLNTFNNGSVKLSFDRCWLVLSGIGDKTDQPILVSCMEMHDNNNVCLTSAALNIFCIVQNAVI